MKRNKKPSVDELFEAQFSDVANDSPSDREAKSHIDFSKEHQRKMEQAQSAAAKNEEAYRQALQELSKNNDIQFYKTENEDGSVDVRTIEDDLEINMSVVDESLSSDTEIEEDDFIPFDDFEEVEPDDKALKDKKKKKRQKEHDAALKKSEAERQRLIEEQRRKDRYNESHSAQSNLSEAEIRNRQYFDDDKDIQAAARQEEAKAKTDSLAAEQRAKQAASQEYEGYGSHGIDMSGRGDHASSSTDKYDNMRSAASEDPEYKRSETATVNQQYNKADLREHDSQSRKPEKATVRETYQGSRQDEQPAKPEHVNDNRTSVDYGRSYSSQDNYQNEKIDSREPKAQRQVSDKPGYDNKPITYNKNDINNDSHTGYVSDTEKRNHQYYDDDRIEEKQKYQEARREQIRDTKSPSDTAYKSQSRTSNNYDNHTPQKGIDYTTGRRDERKPTSTTTPQDVKYPHSESRGNDDVRTPSQSQSRTESYTRPSEKQTSFSNYGTEYKRTVQESSKTGDRTESRPKGSQQGYAAPTGRVEDKGSRSQGFQKNDTYKADYKPTSGTNSKNAGELKSVGQAGRQNQTYAASPKSYSFSSDRRVDNVPRTPARNEIIKDSISRRASGQSRYRSSDPRILGSGKDLSMESEFHAQDTALRKQHPETAATVLGTGAALNKVNEIKSNPYSSARTEVKGTDMNRSFTRQATVVATGKNLYSNMPVSTSSYGSSYRKTPEAPATSKRTTNGSQKAPSSGINTPKKSVSNVTYSSSYKSSGPIAPGKELKNSPNNTKAPIAGVATAAGIAKADTVRRTATESIVRNKKIGVATPEAKIRVNNILHDAKDNIRDPEMVKKAQELIKLDKKPQLTSGKTVPTLDLRKKLEKSAVKSDDSKLKTKPHKAKEDRQRFNSAKLNFAKRLGAPILYAGGTIITATTRELVRTIEQTDAGRAAATSRDLFMAAHGLIIGRRSYVPQQNIRGIFTNAKIKRQNISNVWEKFKGGKVKELNFVAHTANQRNLLMNQKRFANFKGLDIRRINKELKKIDKSIKADPIMLKNSKFTSGELKANIAALRDKINKLKGLEKLSPAQEKLLAGLERRLGKLKNLEKLVERREGLEKFKKVFFGKKTRKRSGRRAADLFFRHVLSDDGQVFATMLSSTRFLKTGIKASYKATRLAWKAKSMPFKVAAAPFKGINRVYHWKPIYNSKGMVRLRASVPGQKLSHLTNQAHVLQKKVSSGLHGGIYESMKKKVPEPIKKASTKIGKTKSKVKAASNKTKKPFKKVKEKAKEKWNQFLSSKAGKVVAAPFKAFSALGVFMGWIKKIAIVGAAILCLLFFFVDIFSAAIQPLVMIFDSEESLQKYVDVLNDKSKSWFKQIENYQNQGEKKHGRYKNVTVSYLDEDGNQIQSTDNTKDILSMIYIQRDYDWPDWWQVFSREGVVNDSKTLFDKTHNIETEEFGPYPCSGVNCEKRDYYCEQEILGAAPSDWIYKSSDAAKWQPYYASAQRITDHNNYYKYNACYKTSARKITYYCNTDKATFLEGKYKNNTYSNAHSEVWATDSMRSLYSNNYYRGGCTTKHGTWKGYFNQTNSCGNYEFYPELTQYREYTDWPTSLTYTWDSSIGKYKCHFKSSINTNEWDYTWKLDHSKYGNSITLKYNSKSGNYESTGTFYCQEYQCKGHSMYVRKCEGHTEYWCPHDHYDLDVNATILHVPGENDPVKSTAIYEVDPKSKGVVNKTPADTDDFYWDLDNRSNAENVCNQNWNDLYPDLTGLRNAGVEGEILKDKEIDELMKPANDTGNAKIKKVVKTALGSVGRIPYYWGGYASYPGLDKNNFGTKVKADKNGNVKKGLDAAHFVDWVSWTALNDNLKNDWTRTIWNQTTAVEKEDLRPGDLGFQNTGGITTNHVGIYIGDDKWVHCSTKAGATVNNTNVFAYYRRLKILP